MLTTYIQREENKGKKDMEEKGKENGKIQEEKREIEALVKSSEKEEKCRRG